MTINNTMLTSDDHDAKRRAQALIYARDEARRSLNAVIAAMTSETNTHRKARLSHIRDRLALVLTELRSVL